MQLSILVSIFAALAATAEVVDARHLDTLGRVAALKRGQSLIRREDGTYIRRMKRGGYCKVRPTDGSGTASSTVPAPTATGSSTSGAVPSVTDSTSSTSATPVEPTTSDSAVPPTSTDSAVPTTSSAVPPSSSVTSTPTVSPTTSSAPTATPSSGGSALAPNGRKAGISGGDAFDDFQAHIGWWYDWSANPSGHTATSSPAPIAIPMLWGDGHLGSDQNDASRFAAFQDLVNSGATPKYAIGFEEPDCSTPGSANIGVGEAATTWNNLMKPLGDRGTILVSPSMCKQLAEDFLTPFSAAISRPWDVTNVHINKNSAEGIRASLDHYAKYGKPMWVTEFACVDDSTGFVPCSDQNQMNSYINTIVDILEADSRVIGYAFSNGIGLGGWALGSSGALTESGQTYLNAIKKYYP